MTLEELDCPVGAPPSGICDLRRIRLSCTKTKVLLPQVYVTLDELDCPVLPQVNLKVPVLKLPHSGICDLRRIRLSCTKTKVHLPQVYVTLDELDCPVLKLRFSSFRYM